MSKKTTTTTKNDPWAPAQPKLREILNEGQDLYQAGTLVPEAYSGQRVAGLSDQTLAGIEALGADNVVTPATQDALLQMLDGDQMYRDFDTIRGTVADDVKSQLAGTFAGGAINSGLAGDTYTRALGEALAGVEYGAYNDAQNRRLSALGMAPSISNMGLQDAQAQLMGGQLLDQQAQAQIDADMAKYYETEDADFQALQRYSALTSGLAGLGGTSSGTSSQPLGLGSIGSLMSGTGGFLGAIL